MQNRMYTLSLLGVLGVSIVGVLAAFPAFFVRLFCFLFVFIGRLGLVVRVRFLAVALSVKLFELFHETVPCHILLNIFRLPQNLTEELQLLLVGC